jgi:MFS family permease
LRPPRRPFASRSTTLDPSATPPPADSNASRAARGLRAQLLATRDAAIGLVQAHIDLARAELSSIAGQVGRIAALVAIAIVVVILAGLLGVIGTTLFLGEWLLGSMGWGVLHGILAFAAIAIAAGLIAAGVGADRVGRSLVVGVVVAVVVGVALGLEWPNRAYVAAGEAARLNVELGVRPLVVGLLIGALIGVLVGFAAAVRIGSGGGRLAAIVGLAILGALVGAFSAITFGPQAGAGVGIAFGYLTWIALMGADVARQGIDVGDLQERFYPTQTIETGKETLEWLQKRMPPGIGS